MLTVGAAGEKDARTLLPNTSQSSPRRGDPMFVNPRFQSMG